MARNPNLIHSSSSSSDNLESDEKAPNPTEQVKNYTLSHKVEYITISETTSLYSMAHLIYIIFPFQVVTVPFPFQSLMKLLLVSMTSGLLLYASPGIVAAFLPHPLKADEMYLSLLVTMGTSVLIPLLFRSVASLCISSLI